MQCSAGQCSAMQCPAVQWNAVKCNAVNQGSAVQCSAVRLNAVWWSRAVDILCSAQINLFFFIRLESLSWFQQDFWQPSLCRKCNLGSLCCDWRTKKKGFSPLLAWRKWKVEKSPLSKPLYYSLSSKKTMKMSTILVSLSKKWIYKTQFLQKGSCQETYWEQAL